MIKNGRVTEDLCIMRYCDNSKNMRSLHSVFNEVVDPLYVGGVHGLSPLRLLFPGVIVDYQKKHIRKVGGRVVEGEVWGALLLGHKDLLLVDEVHVGILLFGLAVAAVT